MTQERGIVAWMAHNPVAANLLMLVVMVAGMQALFGVTKEVFPTFPADTLTITVPYPGSSPEEVEEGIRIKIEEEIQDIVGIKELRSIAQEGSGKVTVQLQPGIDIGPVLSKVEVRVDGIASFPGDAEEPIIEEQVRRTRALSLSIYGELGEFQLKELADKIRDEILSLPGITQVEVQGSREYEISIELSDSALRQYGLQFDDVVKAIQNQSQDLPGGKLRAESRTINLRSIGQAYTAEQFSNLTLITRPDGTRVRVADVALVKDGFEDQPILSRLNGRPAVTLQIDRVGDQNVIAISKAVNKYASEKQQLLPAGVTLAVWADRTEVLKRRINLLLKSALQGVVLVVITLALFLQVSLALWVVVGLPFCFLGTLFLMNLPGVNLSINVVSLFGFILVLGILVDDAIVTAESAYSQLEEENDDIHSIIRGVKRVSVATVFGVMTTIIAFMPIMFLTEGIGHIFSVAAPVIIFCLIFSLIETKLILPAHLRHVRIKKPPSPGEKVSRLQFIQQGFSGFLKKFADSRYRPLLHKAVKFRYTTLAIFIAVFILSVATVNSGLVRQVFFPSVPSDYMVASLEMPQGSSYKLTQQYATKMEAAALAINGLYQQQTGEDRDAITQIELMSLSDTEATIFVELIKSTERDMTSVELANFWRQGIGDLPGIKSLTIDASAERNSIPVDIELQSNDLQQLREAAEEIKAALSSFSGIYDIRDTFGAGGPEVDVQVTREGQALGLGQVELARQVRQAFFGAEIQRVQRGRHEVRVYPRKIS